MPICRYGASSVFEQSNELPIPSVNKNEVLVKIKSTSVNPIDLMKREGYGKTIFEKQSCLLYTSPSPRDQRGSRMPSSA